MLCRVKPYNGTEPYLFFSYCHKNAEQVYPIIEQMAMDGYRIWYDDGIHPGDDWLEVIADRLAHSAGCIAAITPESDSSHNCRSEINLCMELSKPFVSILLKEFELSFATKLQLGATQYVRKFDYSNSKAFYEKLYSASALSECRGAPIDLQPGTNDEIRTQVEEEQRKQVKEAGVKDRRKAEEARRETEEAERLAREKELEALRQKIEEEERRKAEDARREAEEAERLAREKELEALRQKIEEEERRKAEDARREAEEAERMAQKQELEELRRKLKALQEPMNTPENETDATEARIKPSEEDDDNLMVALDSGDGDDLTVVADADDGNDLTIVADADDDDPTVDASSDDDDDPTIVEKKMSPAAVVHLESATYYPIRGAETSIGRSSVSCDIVFPDDHGMSRHHADIIRIYGKSYLRDMKSGNGSYVNGVQMEAGSTVPLENNSWIQLHNVRLLYLTDVLAESVCKTKRISFLWNQKVDMYIVLDGEDLMLRRAKTAGRGCFTDDPKISREKHTMVSLRDGHVYVKDMQSRNGTYIDGKKLDPQKEYPLLNGSKLRIGDTILQCVDLQLNEGDI